MGQSSFVQGLTKRVKMRLLQPPRAWCKKTAQEAGLTYSNTTAYKINCFQRCRGENLSSILTCHHHTCFFSFYILPEVCKYYKKKINNMPYCHNLICLFWLCEAWVGIWHHISRPRRAMLNIYSALHHLSEMYKGIMSH